MPSSEAVDLEAVAEEACELLGVVLDALMDAAQEFEQIEDTPMPLSDHLERALRRGMTCEAVLRRIFAVAPADRRRRLAAMLREEASDQAPQITGDDRRWRYAYADPSERYPVLPEPKVAVEQALEQARRARTFASGPLQEVLRGRV